jgi:mannose-6-phosphate isomerase
MEQLPRKTEKPWGYELLWALTGKYAGKLIFIKKEHRLSLQYHSKKDESMLIQSGKIFMELEDKNGTGQTRVMGPGDIIHLPPFTKHRLQAVEDTILIEVSTPELDDVTRLADDYGRTAK